MSQFEPQQAKLGSYGEMVRGIQALHASVRQLCTMQKGSVPHRPTMGIDWLAVLDLPYLETVPVLVLDVHRNLGEHEPRVKVTRVQVLPQEQGTPGVRCRVYWVPAAGGEEQVTEL